ncbi:hypothetical protein HY061_02255 [Candidatus Azambacteria bacterium]|nr:hypothetical protein [Candidatus Azambacteria bacterium]
MTKGSMLLKILTTISDQTVDFLAILESLVLVRHGDSLGKMQYEHYQRQEKRLSERLTRDSQKESKRRLQRYISKLKQDGLIELTKENQISLTSRGFDKIEELKSRPYNQGFQIEESSQVIIISFDIPEKYRKNRNWLRGVLKFLNFEMVHQSTWVGKIKIPEKLLEQLEKMEILKYIKIFEVTKTGTLKELK